MIAVAIAPVKKIYPKKKVPLAWIKKKPPYTVGKDGFNYSNVKFDPGGWAEEKRFRPFPYDLVKIKTTDHFRTGWWNGNNWDGLRLKPDEKVLYWKQVRHETFSQIG